MSNPSGDSWVRNLLRSDAWPHHAQNLRLIETHISWVILTGKLAYKIKKPVNLGFVDFSTLPQRKYFCDEELRINRRLAPEIYLDVVEIRGSMERPFISDDAGLPLIDYAVRMNQFDDSMLLSHLAAQRQITPQHVDLLADEVAEFHKKVAVASPGSQWTQSSAAVQPAFDNFSALLSLDGELPQDELQELNRWTSLEADQLSETFAARGNAGFVRECHGDMHLGNMYLSTPERITIFDGIEFNPALRWIDVMSEVAFAMMDLADRGYPGLSWRFLNRWLESTGDFEGLRVLKWYLVYRAMVRAKVGMLRAHQTAADSGLRAAIVREVRDYLTLARQYTAKRKAGLWITCGVSGSGKTYGSQGLVEQQQLIRIRSDVERKRIAGLTPTARTNSAVDSGLYSPHQSEAVYARLLTLSRLLIASGYSVIVDATFLKRNQRADFCRLAEECHVPFQILLFEVTPDILRQRIQQRSQSGKDASDATMEVALQQLKVFEPLSAEEQVFVQNPFSPSSS